ncbi:unnamed protein product [Symbiodinium sp. CCMP2592]|nr:unnamed protein product [Symbiodinium sp. CCMP2592]
MSEPLPPLTSSSARIRPTQPSGQPVSLPVREPPEHARHTYGSVELCLPTPRHTVVASLLSMVFMTAGLVVFAISEQGLPGIPKSHGLAVVLRVLGWTVMYFVPVHHIAIANIRGFTLTGIRPGDTALVCSRTALSPTISAEFAGKHHLSTRRAWCGAALMIALFFSLYAGFFALYLGEEYQHPGFVLAYGVGHIVVIVVGEAVGAKCHLKPLDERYASKMGPCTLGPALVGFFIGTSGYGVARRHSGPWLGALMPFMLSGYELLCLHIIASTFSAEYVQEKAVRQKYSQDNQGVVISLAIAMIHALAEGARLTLILVDIAHDERHLDFLVPICSGVVWNATVRAGYLDRFAAFATCGWRTPTNASLLLQEVKYCMGYPRFFAVAAIALARLCTLNEVLPKNQEMIGWALLAMFAAEILEDIISFALERLDLRVHPKPRQITDEEVEIMVANGTKSSHDSLSFPSGFKAIVPKAWLDDQQAGVPIPPANMSKEIRKKCWQLRAAFDFAYGDVENFGKLPFWAHFAAIAIAQFHTVLFMIILSNGLNYVLGFCPESGYSGVGRALLWWPVTDPEDLCDGAICRKFGPKLSVASQSGSLLLVSGVLAALWCYALWAFHLASVTAPRCRSCEDAAAEPRISLEWSASDDFPEDFAPLLALKQLLFVGEGISGALVEELKLEGQAGFHPKASLSCLYLPLASGGLLQSDFHRATVEQMACLKIPGEVRSRDDLSQHLELRGRMVCPGRTPAILLSPFPDNCRCTCCVACHDLAECLCACRYVGPAFERRRAAALSESARSRHGFQLFSGYLLSHMLWRRWRRQESRPAVCVAASKLSILEAGSRLQQSARELIKKNGQGIVFSYPLCFGLNACICLVLGGTSYVWTRRCRPLVLCPFHVDSKLFGYFTAIYLSYGTLCYPLQLGAAVALAPKFSRSFRALKSRMGLNWFMAGAWLLALIAASLAAVMAGIVFALALWPGGRRPPGPRHGWPRTIGGGRLPEIKGCISDTEKQKVKELPKSSGRPKKHSGPQDVSLEAACAFWNIATPAEERRAQQARRNTSKDSSKGAKYSGEDAVSRVLNAGPGAPELARAVGLPVQVAKEAASLFRRFGNIPSKGSLFQGKLQMSRLPEVLVALCDVTEISEISKAFVDWALKAADRDSSSSMDVQEFAIWYSSFCFAEEVTVKPEVRETRELARQMGLEIGQIEQFKVAFDRYDEDGSGEIEFEEFSNMVQELLKIPHGQELPHDRLMTMWRSADMQQKGCLDFREFCFFYFRMGATGQGSDPIADYYRNVRHVPVAP